MARYVTRVRTPMSAEEAFAYMADLRRFAEWDPGVRRVVQVEGDGGGPEAVFDMTVATLGPDLTLRYETTEYDAPRSFRVVATSAFFTSDDRIRVETKRGKTIVTYDAELRLKGPLGFFDLGLRLVFGRIGDHAAAGLRNALRGVEA
jgi:hypothetical protein